ncbi:MAG: phospholipid carrier-dependent glycosyltransferase [Anaerolineales bacterium]
MTSPSPVRTPERPSGRRMLGLLLPLSLFAIWGVARLPFHPDETSWLYMSRDFETWLTRPWALAWNPARESDPEQNYRELNAPAAKYVIGLARWLSGIPANSVNVDWDWSKTWGENQQRGALPSPRVVWPARLGITLLLPISLALLYRTTRRVGGEIGGLSAALLLGLNGLTLLHDRRAMAEGALTLGMALSLGGMLASGRRPWLAGATIAFAISAKQSLAALLPVGLLAALWPPGNGSARTLGSRLARFAISFALAFWLLNPILWSQPFGALRAMLRAREALLREQAAAIESVSPGYALSTPDERLAALVAHTFFTPPAFEELTNYLSETAAEKATYLAMPGHNLLREFVGGGVILILMLFGLGLAGLRVARASRLLRRGLILLLLTTFAQAASLIAAVPLPFQRYYLPLLPLACLWAGYGLGSLRRSRL